MPRKIKIAWRFSQLILHLISGVILAAIFLPRKMTGGSVAARLSIWWHFRLCRIFGVRHVKHGEINLTPTLFVANHISWFDIPAIGAAIPLHFLAKDEIASWPVIGWLANKTGTLFIRRGGKDAARQSIDIISKVLQSGSHVLVFPEGTTCDGVKLGFFHSRLLQAAIDANVVIQPLAITYPHADGIHPHAPYIGDVQMFSSAMNFMASDDITVSLHFLPVLDPKDFAGRDAITDTAKQMIAAVVETQPLAQHPL
jgi:1-acyl-sn-glycerol-3-phosphate acyltransferase